MSEDDYLLSEILFNPPSAAQLARISAALDDLRHIIERRDTSAMTAFLHRVRKSSAPPSAGSSAQGQNPLLKLEEGYCKSRRL